ncbi:hypothetical protein BLOT_015340 [Blomia tropicalis]|nr:hypothetical protein BLOT_015340 [Blomia tropicalis]
MIFNIVLKSTNCLRSYPSKVLEAFDAFNVPLFFKLYGHIEAAIKQFYISNENAIRGDGELVSMFAGRVIIIVERTGRTFDVTQQLSICERWVPITKMEPAQCENASNVSFHF